MKDRIKELRKALGMSQREFAQRLGITASSMGAWERGLTAPTVKNVFQICQVFNVRREWLENGDGEMFEERPGEMTEKEKNERIILSEFRRLPPQTQDVMLRIAIILAEQSEKIEELKRNQKK